MHSVFCNPFADMAALAASASNALDPQQISAADVAACYPYWPTMAGGSLLQLQLSPMAFANGSDCAKDPPPSQSVGALEDAFEPSREPCADEIPWADLVFWLGDDATGSVEACACSSCWREWQRARVRRRRQRKWQHAPYGKLSSKIPVINLPRIEGIN